MRKRASTANDETDSIPVWMPRPRDVRRRRRIGSAAALCTFIVLASLGCAVFYAKTMGDFWSGYIVIAVVAFVCGAALLVAYLRMGRLTDPVLRFFVWTEYKKKQRDKSARAQQDAEPVDGAYWIDKLTKRVARLHRLAELDAPTVIIDNEKRMVREAIAKLPPAQALSVLASWSELSTGLNPQAGERDEHDEDEKPN
jgi:hypothetical protein